MCLYCVHCVYKLVAIVCIQPADHAETEGFYVSDVVQCLGEDYQHKTGCIP